MIIEYITYISVFNLLIFSAFLLLKKNKSSEGYKLLAFIFLIIAYTQIILLLYYNGSIEKYNYLAYSESIFFYLFSPLLYLYVLFLVKQKTSFQIKDLLYLLTALPGLVYYFVFMSESSNDRISSIRTIYCGPLPDIFLNTIGGFTQVVFIVLALRVLMKNSYKLSKDKQSDIQFMRLLLIFFFNLAIFYLVAIHLTLDKKLIDFISFLLLDLIFFAFFYRTIIYPSVHYLASLEDEKNNVEDIYETMLKNKISDKEVDSIKNRLDTVIKKKHVYTNPNITLPLLAKEIGTTTHKLSFILNQHYNLAFFDFINQLRIIKFLNEIYEGNANNNKLMSLAIDCGFNSKSSFYSAFKKLTNNSPKYFVEHPSEILVFLENHEFAIKYKLVPILNEQP